MHQSDHQQIYNYASKDTSKFGKYDFSDNRVSHCFLKCHLIALIYPIHLIAQAPNFILVRKAAKCSL